MRRPKLPACAGGSNEPEPVTLTAPGSSPELTRMLNVIRYPGAAADASAALATGSIALLAPQPEIAPAPATARAATTRPVADRRARVSMRVMCQGYPQGPAAAPGARRTDGP